MKTSFITFKWCKKTFVKTFVIKQPINKKMKLLLILGLLGLLGLAIYFLV
jgi:hypothetical protein